MWGPFILDIIMAKTFHQIVIEDKPKKGDRLICVEAHSGLFTEGQQYLVYSNRVAGFYIIDNTGYKHSSTSTLFDFVNSNLSEKDML